MKQTMIMFLLLLLSACVVEVGNFPDKRIKLHEMGYPDNYCEQNPDRCVQGVPW